jgi:hypothetical protein
MKINKSSIQKKENILKNPLKTPPNLKLSLQANTLSKVRTTQNLTQNT